MVKNNIPHECGIKSRLHNSIVAITTRVFFSQFCNVTNQYGNHPQEDLAKFGYSSGLKVEIFTIPIYIFITCWIHYGNQVIFFFFDFRLLHEKANFFKKLFICVEIIFFNEKKK
jgi:hypothetical protein